MKRRFLKIAFILTIFVFTLLSTYADSDPNANIKGPDILRIEDTLTVIYSVDNIQCSGFQGNISYDKELMLLSDANVFDSKWNVEVMPSGMFLAYSKTPADSESFFEGGELFSLTFTLKNTAKEKDALTVDITSVIAATVSSDGDSEIPIPDASYVKQIDPPASSDATLSALSISGTSFSPAFSPDITEYTIPLGVDYTVNALTIAATASHEKAKFEIIGNELSVGNNIITIKVTAEDGTERIYSIKVKRAHDPSKPMSDDTRLSQLIISCGSLSPAFSPDTRQYAVYLPYGTSTIDVSAIPYNEFASDILPATHSLSEGINVIKVLCVAEDSTVGEYVLNVCVMPQYQGFIPEINNNIPLSGDVLIDGVLNVGETLRASLSDTDESQYRVEWYRQGEKISEGALYTVTELDKNSVIYAEIIGVGNYNGSFISEKMYVTDDGIIVDLDEYVTLPAQSFNVGATLMCILIAAAIFLAIGFLAGSIKKRSQRNKQTS